MSRHTPNRQQLEAIGARDENIVISAGAGSGKTTVLALRFAALMLGDGDGWAPLEPDRLLAITFTRKAAAELAERVRRELLSHPMGGVHQSRALDRSWISTIDAFCARILRRHMLDLGRDPEVRFADEVETGLLKAQAAERVLERAVRAEGAAAELVHALGYERAGESLSRDTERLRAMGKTPSDIDVLEPRGFDEATARATTAAEALRSGIAGIEPLRATHERNLEVAAAVVEACGCAERSTEAERAADILATVAGGSFSRAARPKEEAAAAQSALEELKTACADVIVQPYAAAYREMLSDYDETYAAIKREAGLVDFQDALAITGVLLGSDGLLVDRYRRQFADVMIDEFQDTNAQQLEALGPVSDGRLCAVGDVQQSIYGFRYADVEVMRTLADRADRVIPLSVNYRSHPDILRFVNTVFGESGLLGDDFLRLEPGRTEFPSRRADEPRVEYCCYDTTDDGGYPAAEGMAECAAARAAEMIETGFEPSEVVVLMRSMTHAGLVARRLEARGLPARLASGETLFEMSEVIDVRSLLRVLAVPHDDAAMLRVLLSPVCGLGDDTVMAVRLYADSLTASSGSGRASLYRALQVLAFEESEAVPVPDRAGVVEFAKGLNRLGEALRNGGVAHAIHAAVHEFDYDLALLASGSEGDAAWGNVLKLMHLAEEFDRTHRGDVRSFLEYLRAREEHASTGVAATAPADRSVRIMSIHAAKGLEFPAVVLAGLQATLTRGASEQVLVERVGQEVLLSMRTPPDGSALERLKDSRYDAVAEHRQMRELSEEARILYVACTRAQESLVLVGAGDPAKLRNGTALKLLHQPLGDAMKAGVHELGGARVRVRVEDAVTLEADGERAVERRAVQSPVEEGGCQLSAEEATTQTGPPAGDATAREVRPATVSYSSLHRFEQCGFRFYAEQVLGMRASADAKSQAAAFGSALHVALERIGQTDASASIEAAARSQSLEADQRARLHEAVDAFAGSELYHRLVSAQRLGREEPFCVRLGDRDLIGSIDAFAWDGDAALVVDYKTGADTDLSRTSSRLAGYELQAKCYALAAFESGAQHVDVVFSFVEQGPAEISYAFSRDEHVGLRRELETAVERLKPQAYVSLDTYDAEACGGCPVLGTLCPIDPPRSAAG